MCVRHDERKPFPGRREAAQRRLAGAPSGKSRREGKTFFSEAGPLGTEGRSDREHFLVGNAENCFQFNLHQL